MTSILITGGTGKVGSRVIEQLAGRPGVRALAHSDRSADRLAAAGVDVVRGSLADPAAVAAALDGVERLFLLAPYSPDQAEHELAAIEAARAAGVGHVVKLSSLLDALHDGVVVAPTRDAALAFVDARDIAAVAVHELTAAEPVGGDLVLTGPEALTYTAYAERLGEGIGRPVRHVSPPPAEFAAALRGFGVPGFYADDLTAMFAAIAEAGATHPATDTVARIAGRPPHDARAFARDVLAPALAVRGLA